jgi:type IV secretory pathway protease TraF
VNGKPILIREVHVESENQKIQEWKIGVSEIFVLGDNFKDSIDSRIYGPININLVKGRAWLRVWPLNLIGRNF